MNKKRIYILISLFWIIFSYIRANNGRNQIYLSVDRTVYALNDEIYYHIVDVGNCNVLDNTIYNLSVSSPSGEIVCKARHWIRNGIGSGKFKIPRHLVPGIYKIIGYPEFLSNLGEKAFNSIPITILNSKGNNVPVVSKGDSLWLDGVISKDTLIVQSGSEITIPKHNFDNFSRILNVSLVPTACVVNNNFDLSEPINVDCNTLRGLGVPLLKGRVTKEFEFGDEVYLNILTSRCILLVESVNDSGYFSFKLPLLNRDVDMVITTSNGSALINIESDNINRFSSFSPSESRLSEVEQQILSNILIYKELEDRYDRSNTEVNGHVEQKPFYGDPILTFDPDDYIDLGSLQEYILELPMHVLLTNKTEFQIFNSDFKRVDYLYKPLVLVNNVVSPNTADILSIEPNDIRKFEVIDKRYSIGGFTYSGIFNIKTNSNINTVNANKNLQVIRYVGFSKEEKVKSIELSEINSHGNIPILNSTIYWKSMDEKNYNISVGDQKGNFTFIINGLDIKGEINQRIVHLLIK